VAQATYAQDMRELLHFRRTLVSFRSRFLPHWDRSRLHSGIPAKARPVLTTSGAIMQKRAGIYVRVSTDKQTIDNQVAGRGACAGWKKQKRETAQRSGKPA